MSSGQKSKFWVIARNDPIPRCPLTELTGLPILPHLLASLWNLTSTPNSPPCHLWFLSGCLFWFLFYTLAGRFLFTLLEIVFPPSPQCGFLTDTEAPAWLPQRASSNLALAQQDRCQEGGIITAKQNTKRTKKKLQKKKKGLVLILTQKEKLS